MNSFIDFSFLARQDANKTPHRAANAKLVSFHRPNRMKEISIKSSRVQLSGSAKRPLSAIRKNSSRISKQLLVNTDTLENIDRHKPTLSCGFPRKCSLPSSSPNPKTRVCFPISNQSALGYFSNQLSDYEKEEIKFYNNVYFLPKTSKKITLAAMFDDSNGNYNAIAGDQLVYRYEIIQMLGRGAFGVSYKCFDHKLKQFLAVKILRNLKRTESQGETEVRILKKLKFNNVNSQYGVVCILDNFKFRGHTCIVFELLDLSLLQHLKLNNRRGVPIEVARSYTKCILTTLVFLKSLQIIHSDIKPANILFSNNPSVPIKLIDFGTSCFTNEVIFNYIQSRFYRAPEVLLGMQYDEAIDMWSFGCVLYEMVTGSVLFKGSNEVQVLMKISSYKGRPSGEFFSKIRKNYCELTEKKEGFEGKINDKALVDLLEKCLTWEPRLRITPEDALVHSWIKESG